MNQRGFSLVEFMIALVLGMTVVLGITTLFIDSSKTVTDVNRAHRALENTLFAIDTIASEAGLIGYWGESSSPIIARQADWGPLRDGEITEGETTGFTNVPICIGAGTSGYSTKVELGFAMQYPVASSTGDNLNLSQCGLGSTPSSDNDFISIRRASTCAYTGGSTTCPLVENTYYIQTNGCYNETIEWYGGEIVIRQVNSDNVDTAFPYALYGCVLDAPIYTYVVNTYYINDQEQLMRLYLDDTNTYVEDMLVEGVEHMSFEWFIDTDGDLEHDIVTDTLSQSHANSIRGVKIWMVIRGLDRIPDYYDDYTYTIAGEVWEVPEENKSYSRMLMTQMIDINRVVDIQRSNNGKGSGRK